jgi:hypothetical protein
MSDPAKDAYREKIRRFRDLNLRCTMCNAKGERWPMYPWKVFGGRLVAPLCYACMMFYGRPGVDKITPMLEERIKEYFTREKAFWHPREKIEPIEPEEEEKG